MHIFFLDLQGTIASNPHQIALVVLVVAGAVPPTGVDLINRPR